MIRVMFVIGAVLLLAAAAYGVQNYLLTRSISNYWLLFSIAMASGAIMWVLMLVEATAIGGDPVQRIRRSVSVVFITLMVVLAFDMLTTDIGETMAENSSHT